MADRKAELGALVSGKNVLDDTKTLNNYSEDQSFARKVKPACVAKPRDANDVQKIVQWANRTNTPLIPGKLGAASFSWRYGARGSRGGYCRSKRYEKNHQHKPPRQNGDSRARCYL